MTLDDKHKALNFLAMALEIQLDGLEDDELESYRLAEQLMIQLEQQNDAALLHRDVTRKATEQYPHLTLAQARKLATTAINKTSKEQ
jgi:hypothetical protein